MIPLVTDPFYAAMSVTVMCGLAFATLLTLVAIPVNYALIFRLLRAQRSVCRPGPDAPFAATLMRGRVVPPPARGSRLPRFPHYYLVISSGPW